MKILKLITPIFTALMLVACSNNYEVKQEDNREVKEVDVGVKNQLVEQEDGQEEKNNEPGLQLDKKYFNEAMTVDGKEVIKNVDNTLILINKESASLPSDYIPSDLVIPDVNFSFTVNPNIEKSYIKREASEALELLFKQAESENIYLFAVSGYRSYERQNVLFEAKVNQVGTQEKAKEVVAIPGTSEHQTGLTMDISSESVGFELEESFADTVEGNWLAENAHKYGFILRYPKGKESITGYTFEPWHYRYVGKEAAKIIFENNWTLEEFFEEAMEM